MARIFVNFARAIQFSGCFTRTRASVSVRFESVPKKKEETSSSEHTHVHIRKIDLRMALLYNSFGIVMYLIFAPSLEVK